MNDDPSLRLHGTGVISFYELNLPAEFPEILKDLNREVLRSQPKDIYQFCANYFYGKLADQRKELIELASAVGDESAGKDESGTVRKDQKLEEAPGTPAKDSDDDSDSDEDSEEDDQPAMPPTSSEP
ncbi:hypothetical protein HDU81_008214 [Chytriomyces hyalinus]|nr:hypothetical protein HDU81_008214 [Chytriomyces hyalinus]